jgi:hypothetical protein
LGGILLLVGVLALAALVALAGYAVGYSRLDDVVCVVVSRSACGKFGIVGDPGDFREAAETPFFFSIGRQLKHGKSIDENAPTFFTAEKTLDYVFAAPDQQKAAVVSGQTLYLAEPGKPPVRLLENIIAPGWADDEEIPFMQLWRGENAKPSVPLFYKAASLQWDAASRYLHVMRETKGEDNMLLRFDTQHPALEPEEITRNAGSRYFLVGDDNLCFERGHEELREWRCVTPQGELRLDSFADGILRLENGETLVGAPFLSFHANGHATAVWMKHGGFFFHSIKTPDGDGDALLYSDRRPDTPLFRFKRVKYSRPQAPADGFLPRRTVVLPGGRYLFLSFLFGDFLVDRDTDLYRILPKATRVPVNLNSAHNPRFRGEESPLPSFRYFTSH